MTEHQTAQADEPTSDAPGHTRIEDRMDDLLITATLRDHVRHVVTSLLRPDELDSWAFRIDDEEGAGRRKLWVDIVAKGEPYAGYLWHERPPSAPKTASECSPMVSRTSSPSHALPGASSAS